MSKPVLPSGTKRRERGNAKRPADRPTADLGHQVRALRLAAGLTQPEVGARAKIRQAQFSAVEGGRNVESQQYTAIARALGFRTALEMFRADPRDPKRDHLLRGWAVLPDEARTRVLRFLNRLLTGDTD